MMDGRREIYIGACEWMLSDIVFVLIAEDLCDNYTQVHKKKCILYC